MVVQWFARFSEKWESYFICFLILTLFSKYMKIKEVRYIFCMRGHTEMIGQVFIK